ncbi:MBL fold metallo-hydrolase [Caldanaerobacter subterraneus]|nr:MBL fold metallo-hydrolase [Caldanaerobacter subterraneus]NNG67920.1 MBL fold metallo-hydrolase [Caldanaerobacter subterraneus]
MEVKRYVVGPYGANLYVVWDRDTREGIIIDPGEVYDEIKNYIKENGIKVKHILLTHGHFDHIGGVEEIRAFTGGKVAISEEDAPMLLDSSQNLSEMVFKKVICSPADIILKDKDVLGFGNYSVEVISTPGHTKGSVCFKIGDVCFTGDTLFRGSIGRHDFPGGNFETLMASIKERLLTLKDETVIYPGHGDFSTIGREKRLNMFLKNLV